eukprot:m.905312 g.905312  ORF g.905312 m.905312 type:complete len:996 (+) comp23699_c0_seq2:471-3458(+)
MITRSPLRKVTMWRRGAIRKGFITSSQTLFSAGVILASFLCIWLLLSRLEVREKNTHVNVKAETTPESEPQVKESMIPTIIHQTWKTEQIPEDLLPMTQTWPEMNPNYTYMLHTDAQIEMNMAQWYPELSRAWQRMKPIEKADTYRYAVLHHYGGYYADLDVTCARPIDVWTKQNFQYDNVDFIVGFEVVTERPDWAVWYARKFQLCQWTMAGRKGHPAFRIVLDMIVDWFDTHTDAERVNISVVQSTGPGIWSDAVLEFLNKTHQVQFGGDLDMMNGRIDASTARNVMIHAGTAMVLPVRSFAINSGGYQLASDMNPDEILVRHYFKGSWKPKPVDEFDFGGYETYARWPHDYLRCTALDTQRQPVDPQTMVVPHAQSMVVCNTGSTPDAEPVYKAVDHNAVTKFLTYADFRDEAVLSYNKNPQVIFATCDFADKTPNDRTRAHGIYTKMLEEGDFVSFCGGNFAAQVMTSYSLVSANDFDIRDPKSWTLEGGVFDDSFNLLDTDVNETGSFPGSLRGMRWTLLDARVNMTFATRFERQTFQFENTNPFGVYRLNITSINVPESTLDLQLSEISLHLPQWNSTLAAAKCSNATSHAYYQQQHNLSFSVCGHALPDTSPSAALDGNVLSVFTSTTATTELVGTPLDQYADALFITPSDGRAISFEQYAMVSATTLPSRDPAAWVLLGETQASGTWRELDRRSMMTFDDRTALQMFSLPSASAQYMPITALKLVVTGIANDSEAGCFPDKGSCWHVAEFAPVTSGHSVRFVAESQESKEQEPINVADNNLNPDIPPTCWSAMDEPSCVINSTCEWVKKHQYCRHKAAPTIVPRSSSNSGATNDQVRRVPCWRGDTAQECSTIMHCSWNLHSKVCVRNISIVDGTALQCNQATNDATCLAMEQCVWKPAGSSVMVDPQQAISRCVLRPWSARDEVESVVALTQQSNMGLLRDALELHQMVVNARALDEAEDIVEYLNDELQSVLNELSERRDVSATD